MKNVGDILCTQLNERKAGEEYASTASFPRFLFYQLQISRRDQKNKKLLTQLKLLSPILVLLC